MAGQRHESQSDDESKPARLRLPFGAQLATFLILAAVVLGGAGSLLLWGLGGRHVLTVSDQLDLVKITLSIVAGIGGVVALTVAYRKQRLSELAEHRADAAHRREEIKLFNERFGACAEQLGNGQAAVRLAGIHALAGLADDWPDGRQTCIDVLCAYLRMPFPPNPPSDVEANEQWHRERQVRHTIWRTIGRHLRPDAEVSWCGGDLDFTGAVIDGGDLSGSCFLSGGRVSFDFARLVGLLSFEGAQFLGGAVSFDGARFDGGRVSFDGARFDGCEVSFNEAEFGGGVVTMRGAELIEGRLSFAFASFESGVLSFDSACLLGGEVNFDHAIFDVGGRISFTEAKFLGARVDLQHATFAGGTVDIASPAKYDRAPELGARDSSPDGLLLPPTAGPAGCPNEHGEVSARCAE